MAEDISVQNPDIIIEDEHRFKTNTSNRISPVSNILLNIVCIMCNYLHCAHTAYYNDFTD